MVILSIDWSRKGSSRTMLILKTHAINAHRKVITLYYVLIHIREGGLTVRYNVIIANNMVIIRINVLNFKNKMRSPLTVTIIVHDIIINS